MREAASRSWKVARMALPDLGLLQKQVGQKDQEDGEADDHDPLGQEIEPAQGDRVVMVSGLLIDSGTGVQMSMAMFCMKHGEADHGEHDRVDRSAAGGVSGSPFR